MFTRLEPSQFQQSLLQMAAAPTIAHAVDYLLSDADGKGRWRALSILLYRFLAVGDAAVGSGDWSVAEKMELLKPSASTGASQALQETARRAAREEQKLAAALRTGATPRPKPGPRPPPQRPAAPAREPAPIA